MKSSVSLTIDPSRFRSPKKIIGFSNAFEEVIVLNNKKVFAVIDTNRNPER